MIELADANKYIPQILKHLPQKMQDAMLLRYYLGLDIDLAAAGLGLSEISVQRLLDRSIEYLAAELSVYFPATAKDIRQTILKNPQKFLYEPLKDINTQHMEELKHLDGPENAVSPELLKKTMDLLAAKKTVDGFLQNVPDKNAVVNSFSNQIKIAQKKKQGRLSLKKYLRAACVAILIFVLLSGGIILGVEGIRVKVLNMLSDPYATTISFDNSYMEQEINLAYVPEGFELYEKNVQDGYLYLKFKQDTFYFSLTIRDEDTIAHIDTEDAVVTNITIQGNDAICSKKEDLCTVFFRDKTYSYTVLGNIPDNQIIEIAENIKTIG